MTCGAPAEIDSLSSLSSPLTTERNRTREPRVRPHPELPAQVALLRLAALRARRDALRGHDDLHLVVGPSIDRSIDRSIDPRSTLDRPSPRSLRTNSRVFGVCVSSARRRRSPLPALLSGRAATARGAAARRPHPTGHPQDVRSVDHEKRTTRAPLSSRARARARRSQVPRVRRDDPRGEHLPVHPLRDRHCAGPDGPRRGPFATVDDASEEEEEDDDDARRSFVRLVCRSRSRRRRLVSRTIRRSLACRSSSTTTTTEPPHPCDGTTISFSSPLRGGVVVRSRVARVVPDRFFGSSRR